VNAKEGIFHKTTTVLVTKYLIFHLISTSCLFLNVVAKLYILTWKRQTGCAKCTNLSFLSDPIANKKSYSSDVFLPFLTLKLQALFTDKDECNDDTANCEQECVNTDGDYVCKCSAGFKGSWNNCTGNPFTIFIKLT
jgi:hypothetical protein